MGMRTVPWSPDRDVVADFLRMGEHKHMMHGFLEVDVTELAARQRARADAGLERLSTTGVLACALGRAMAQHPEVHAYRVGDRLVLFDESDVSLIVETQVRGQPVVVPHVFRDLHVRSAEEVHVQLRAIQRGGMPKRRRRLVDLFPRLPGPVRRAALRAMLAAPERLKAWAGTAGLSSVGMFGRGVAGFALPHPTIHSLGVTVGSLLEKPRFVGGRVMPRQLLSLTLSLDHDVVDGPPATRFARTFAARLESAEDVPLPGRLGR